LSCVGPPLKQFGARPRSLHVGTSFSLRHISGAEWIGNRELHGWSQVPSPNNSRGLRLCVSSVFQGGKDPGPLASSVACSFFWCDYQWYAVCRGRRRSDEATTSCVSSADNVPGSLLHCRLGRRGAPATVLSLFVGGTACSSRRCPRREAHDFAVLGAFFVSVVRGVRRLSLDPMLRSGWVARVGLYERPVRRFAGWLLAEGPVHGRGASSHICLSPRWFCRCGQEKIAR